MILDLLNSLTRSPYWVAAGWTMLHFLWIGAAIAAGTFVLLRLLDRARPEFRHAAALLGFITLVAAPVPIYRWTLTGLVIAPVSSATDARQTSTPWVSLPDRGVDPIQVADRARRVLRAGAARRRRRPPAGRLHGAVFAGEA